MCTCILACSGGRDGDGRETVMEGQEKDRNGRKTRMLERSEDIAGTIMETQKRDKQRISTNTHNNIE